MGDLEKIEATFPVIEVELEEIDPPGPESGPGEDLPDDGRAESLDLMPPVPPDGGLLSLAGLSVNDIVIVQKENAAKEVAARIVDFFGYSLAALFLLGAAVLIASLVLDHSGKLLTIIVKDGLVPFVATVADFGVRVFGPLLGFILGYYFRQTTENSTQMTE